MTPKQRTFCEEYLIDLNATQAAIRAGYSEKTAHSQGPRLLENVGVQEYITKLKQKRSEKAQIDAQWVLDEAVNTYHAATKDNAHTAATSALKLVGQHVDVQALVDKRQIDNTHKFEDMSDEEIQKRLDGLKQGR